MKTNLSGGTFENKTFYRCQSTNFFGSTFENCKFIGVDFRYCNIGYCDFENCEFTDCIEPPKEPWQAGLIAAYNEAKNGNYEPLRNWFDENPEFYEWYDYEVANMVAEVVDDYKNVEYIMRKAGFRV